MQHIRIDYLNYDREVRHSFHILDSLDDCELLGMDIRDIMKDGATDIRIYNNITIK